MAQYEKLLKSLEDLIASGATDTKSLEQAFKDSKPKRTPAQIKAFAKRNGIVTPEKGFAVKTVDGKGKKVFINVCSHNDVPTPVAWNEWVSEQRESRDASVDDLRVPLSIGIAREDSDRGGAGCSVIDCIVNTSVLKVSQISRNLKSHVVRTVVNCVSRERKMQLDPQWRLPKLNAKGDPKPQVLDVVNLPIVQEMDPLSSRQSLSKSGDADSKSWDPLHKTNGKPKLQPLKSGSTPSKADHKSSSSMQPSFPDPPKEDTYNKLHFSLSNVGKPVEQMEVLVSMTDGSLSEETDISLMGFEMVVHAPSCEKLVVQLPFGADEKRSTAAINPDGSLRILLPIKFVKDWWS